MTPGCWTRAAVRSAPGGRGGYGGLCVLGGADDRVDVEDFAPSQGDALPRFSQDEAVTGDEGKADREVESHGALPAGVDPVGPEHPDSHRMFARAEVGEVGTATGDGPIERFEHAERGVEPRGHMPVAGPDEDVAATELVVRHSREVGGHSIAGSDLGAVGVVALQGPNPDLLATGQHDQFVVDPDHAAGECAGDDRAGTFRREDPIDPQAGSLVIDGGRGDVEEAVERGLEGVDAETLTLNLPGVCISTGSACTSAEPEPSHVLKAIGLDEAEARSSIRIGIGRFSCYCQ